MWKYLHQLQEVSARRISSSPHSSLQTRKSLLTKIIAGTAWEEQLVKFVEVFAKRRKEFIFALSIHTAVAVGDVNVKLNVIERGAAEMIQRYVP